MVDNLNQFENMYQEEELDPELQAALFEGRWGPVLGHPLVHQPCYSPVLNHMMNKTLRQKKALIADAEHKKDWNKLIWLHEKPYRLEALMVVRNLMEPEAYWPLLADVWCNVENHWQAKNIIPQLFRTNYRWQRYALIMTDEERHILEAYPSDTLTIYRGHQKVNAHGWSWTFSRERAEWFAKRYSLGRARFVTEGQVARTNVIAFFNQRNENEVVTIPRSVKKVSSHQIKAKALCEEGPSHQVEVHAP